MSVGCTHNARPVLLTVFRGGYLRSMASLPAAGTKRRLTLFTQWRSSVGVGNPSPLNTWPKWPPQLLHKISVRLHRSQRRGQP